MEAEDRSEGFTPGPATPRKIIHVDMDAFYASVEQRDNPELRGKPVAVGGSRERCVVAAASYEARKFGVHSAMPSVTAKRKCPALIFVKPHFDVYRATSLQIREIFADYTPLVEPLSLDEAYLDVTQNLKGIPSAARIAEEIRARIRAETELTASAGVSYNKFLAKLASDYRKLDGLFVITPAMGPVFVESLPVRKFHGIGPATAGNMERLGIKTGFDLRARSLDFLQQHFGKAGGYYYWASRGIDERPVVANRVRKSVGAENTFPADLHTYEAASEGWNAPASPGALITDLIENRAAGQGPLQPEGLAAKAKSRAAAHLLAARCDRCDRRNYSRTRGDDGLAILKSLPRPLSAVSGRCRTAVASGRGRFKYDAGREPEARSHPLTAFATRRVLR